MESYNDIIAIQFLPMNDKFIQKIAVTNVTLQDLGNNQIRPESVTSYIMGSTAESRECETCHYNRSKCPGHPGAIHLGSPILSSIFIPEIIAYLKVICGKCGKIIVKNANNSNIKGILTSITSKIKKGFNCEHCGEPHPHIFENRKENRSFLIQELYHTSVDTKETKKLWVRDLFPSDVKLIFSRLTPETLEKLGIFNPELSPINYINDYFYVLPNSVRPNALSIGAGKGSKHEMNQQINNILKQSNSFGDTSGGLDTVKNAKLIKELSLSVYSYRKPVPTTSDKKPASIASAISSKTGAIRGEVLGARILRIARHFITGDPSVKLDEVLVPLILAEQIQIEEVVTEYNRESLMRYVANGNTVYPRCRSIWKKSTSLTYTLQVVKDVILENGDKIYRDLIEGDNMGFCRQPTLMKSNITGMIVKISINGKTFAFNPNITTLFGADFDGDEMNMYFCKKKSTEALDIDRMGGVRESIISNGYGSPMIGQVQDGTLGCALLTRDGVYLNLQSACRLFDNTGLYPSFSSFSSSFSRSENERENENAKEIKGRDIFTELFRLCGIMINFQTKSTYYKAGLASYRNYSPTEINVVIRDGVFESGIIDKKSVGSKANGGLYHKIYNKYGAQITMDICWYMQQIAINYLYLTGYTMHLNDFDLGSEQYENIQKTEKSIIAESQIHTKNLYEGNIIPPPGKTTEEFYESEQRKILSTSESYNKYIHDGLDYERNHLYFAIHSGAKGSTTNLSEGAIACGQVSVKEKRLKKSLAGRSSHFFPRDSTDPRARGFIANSYFKGLSPVDLINLSYPHRIGLIDKALSTADSGAKYRESISSLDSIIINYYRSVIKGSKLRQTLYGGDGMDPRATFKTTTDLIKKSDLDLRKLDLLEGEFKRLVNARNFIQKLFINIQERTGEDIGALAYIPVNFPLIFSDIASSSLPSVEKNVNKGTSRENYEKITKFIEHIPHFYFNKNYTGPLPDYANESCTLFQSYLTWELRSEVVSKLSEKQIDIMLKLIETNFINNLEDAGACVGIRGAQAITEPNTQQMLDSIHGKAGNKIINFKNIMSATTVAKMKNPSMEIYLTSSSFLLRKNEHEKEEVQEFAKKIEMLKFNYFVNLYQIFYETFGQSVHPVYEHENKTVLKQASVIIPPQDLTNWCIRIEFNLPRLISQNITVEDIYIQIMKAFEYVYIVYETLNTENVFMRVYLRQDANLHYKLFESHELKIFAQDLLNLTIRGINGITATEVKSRSITSVNDLGEMVTTERYYIITEGTNLAEILLLPGVDGRLTKSNALLEMQEFFGITVTRNLTIDGLRSAVDGAYYTHYEIFADEMCATSKFTALNRNGSAARGTSTTQLIADSFPMRFLKAAVKKGKIDYNVGPNSSMIMGTTAKIGTNYAEIVINENFVESFIEKQEDDLENI